LPADVDLLTAGFPCQDLSQAGTTAGIQGKRSGLIGHVFRLLNRRRVPIVLLENVPFMLQLDKGSVMDRLTRAFEELGYRWAYRTVNSLAFLPQRRERVFFVASRCDVDPATVLFADDVTPPSPLTKLDTHAHGFLLDGRHTWSWLGSGCNPHPKKRLYCRSAVLIDDWTLWLFSARLFIMC
jgi:DNA (cytosine-5)-methyltransferase 1